MRRLAHKQLEQERVNQPLGQIKKRVNCKLQTLTLAAVNIAIVAGKCLNLTRLLHVQPDTPLEPLADLPDEQLPADLTSLRQRAVSARPQLHAALTQNTRERRAIELARLDSKPDVTLGFAWIDVADAGLAASSNGQDALLLTAGMNLPIYRKRLDASVRSAEAANGAAAVCGGRRWCGRRCTWQCWWCR